MSNSKERATNTAILGLFAAIVVVLQVISYFIKIGTFNLSLVLVPIVLAGVLYGPKEAGILGALFGAVTAIFAIIGVDGGGLILFNANPVMLILVCLIKGAAAGIVAGLIAQSLKQKNLYLAVILSAVAAPVTNTGIFTAAMFLVFKDTLYSWANGTDVVYYVIFGLLGINFIIELTLNIVLAPAVLTVTRAVSKMHR